MTSSRSRSLLMCVLLSALAACAPEDGPNHPLADELPAPADASQAGPLDAGLDGGREDGAIACTPTLASLQSSLFVPQCALAGCHTGTRAAAALDLTRSDLASLLIGRSASSCDNQVLVAPGRPSASLLLTKMNGHLPAGCGDPMPPAGQAPASALLTCVADWIAALPPAADAGSDGASSDAASCEMCGGSSCVDLKSDRLHCGSCQTQCGANATCAQSTCVCGGGLTSCGGSCVELATDPNNCQGCGVKCASTQLCTPSGCSSTASCGTLTKCGSACVDTKTSGLNCGACGNVCPSGTTCSAGACVCPGGKTLCGGACVDTTSSPDHCGACGNVCGAGKSCTNGACACAGGPVSFAAVAPILADNCTNAGCHVGNMPKEGLDLTATKAYGELVNVRAAQCRDGRVLVPTAGTGKSYLLQKLYGKDMCFGTQMPKAGVSIAPADLALIEAWICNGAQR